MIAMGVFQLRMLYDSVINMGPGISVHCLALKQDISLWPGVLENNLSGPNISTYQRLNFCHFVRHGISMVIAVSGQELPLGLHKN